MKLISLLIVYLNSISVLFFGTWSSGSTAINKYGKLKLNYILHMTGNHCYIRS